MYQIKHVLVDLDNFILAETEYSQWGGNAYPSPLPTNSDLFQAPPKLCLYGKLFDMDS